MWILIPCSLKRNLRNENALKFLSLLAGYRDCVLVGHDWGGAVVFNFANKHPEMVKKLIVLNAPHGAVMFKELMTNYKQFFMSW